MVGNINPIRGKHRALLPKNLFRTHLSFFLSLSLFLSPSPFLYVRIFSVSPFLFWRRKIFVYFSRFADLPLSLSFFHLFFSLSPDLWPPQRSTRLVKSSLDIVTELYCIGADIYILHRIISYIWSKWTDSFEITVYIIYKKYWSCVCVIFRSFSQSVSYIEITEIASRCAYIIDMIFQILEPKRDMYNRHTFFFSQT